jgi:hypothetical protein
VLEGDGTYTYSKESHTYYSVEFLPFGVGVISSSLLGILIYTRCPSKKYFECFMCKNTCLLFLEKVVMNWHLLMHHFGWMLVGWEFFFIG